MTMNLDGIESWLAMTDEVDLNNCDREPIHIPNQIQPHGALLSLNDQGELIQYSQNLESFFGVGHADELRRALLPCFESHQQNEDQLATTQQIHGQMLTVMSHRIDAQRIFEFERADQPQTTSLTAALNRATEAIHQAESVQQIFEIAAKHIQNITNFDRVMAYKFDRDSHGKVIAEAHHPDLDIKYLGLRFPATDIPKQARRLYTLQLTRSIADVHDQPVRLAPEVNPVTNKPLNMSFCQLRSVSPIHIEYLKNMGVAASFSVSIVVDGQLIALMACHHNSPKRLNHDTRQACELLGRMTAMAIKNEHHRTSRLTRSRQLDVQVQLLSELGDVTTLDINSKAWQIAFDFIDAESLLVHIKGEQKIYGATDMDDTFIWAIGSRIANEEELTVQGINDLQKYAPEAQGGLLVVPIEGQGWLGWYRKPEVKMVEWAGKPEHPDAEKSLTPRASFDRWQETLTSQSRPWLQTEEEMGEILARGLSARFGDVDATQGSFERAMRQMRAYVIYLEESNQALHRVNDDLRQFAYAASHDLRAPLRTIRSFLPLVGRTIEDDKTNTWVNYIGDAADTLHRLQEGLWSFSRINRQTTLAQTDLNAVAQRVVSGLAADLTGAKVTIGNLPTLNCVPEQVETLYRNLIDNAAKYQSPDRPLHLVIDARYVDNEWILSVSDNGIGFPPEASHRIFDLFSRVHTDRADGDGLGLALCRRITHHHQGWIRASSEPGQGSTFEFCLKTPRFTNQAQA